ncbi:SDR family NAD(P)-dependent oxidoreductase [Pacificimonas flava]|uniref:Short-chain dehydrogenase/reductase SDR n=1 Tax=Pacificimonas flava TaxID=1234595 RepID=M2U8M1_9SPHN|nr:SDR family NAD(P)-dependent oxidoreductase [Pacificimonas flava]EMD84312.1 short-chain dehydrogenase/reductase SDR [Pacificimonas flava]MBB5279812.1 short-subunit dehydrogenase [Pacificimonas flava]
MSKKLAVITGASTGIGFELAKIAAREGYDLLLAADEPNIVEVAGRLGAGDGAALGVEADLSTFEGNDALLTAIGGRPVDILIANAGRGLGHAFVEQNPAEWRRVIDTNITGTTYLLQKMAQRMSERGEGRILITGSIAGLIPGSFQAVYNGTKAYLDSFAYALRDELKDSGVHITLLMPGPTDTPFFARANMLDTPVGKDDSKEDPAKTAQNGWDALMKGSAHVVSGAKNKAQAALSHLTPDSLLAGQHRKMAEPE